ncbi:MAG: AAA family ATPase [Planctomycetaceae bacterium]
MGQRLKTGLIWFFLLVLLLIVLVNRGNRTREEDEFRSVIFVENDAAIAAVEAGDIVGWRTQHGTLQLVGSEGYVLVCRDSDQTAVRKALVDNAVLPDFEQDRISETSGDRSYIYWILLPLLFFGLLYFFIKRSGSTTNNIFELRKSKARAINEQDKVRFADIGGNRAAVEMLQDLVDFLKEPKRWTDVGARIPRGILLVGPPGTGKTLLARAVAGETNAAFYYTSATEFVEMFVGVGAARVRDTFENAGKNQPAVIFIDELDAIGRTRSSGMGTMHEEREQTLNQLLVLMDGVERFQRVVVIAATNRADVLDSALMRPGRFDRVVRLHAPTETDRIEILRIHTRSKPVAQGLTMETIARHVQGLTGADIEAVLNEAAIVAVRRSRRSNDGEPVAIQEDDVIQAVEDLRKGNRVFNRLDSVLVESVTQFAEPTGRAVARVKTVNGTVIEGDVVWMNATHIKLRTSDADVVVAKELAETIEAIEGTELASDGDFVPDAWTRPNLDVG